MHFVLLDGDQVGPRMEDLFLRNELPRLYFMVQDLNEAIRLLSEVFRKVRGRVYLVGGDTVLGAVGNLEALLHELSSVETLLPCSFSAGIGKDLRHAHIALRVAKARGPGAIVRHRETRGGDRFSRWDGVGGWIDPAGPSTSIRRPSRKRRRPLPAHASSLS